MSTLQDSITEKFLEALKEIKDVEPRVIDELRQLLNADGKPKADDLVKIFTTTPGSEVK